MAKGDHIYTSFWINGNPLTHHGIDCGDGTVIHYDGKRICQVSKSEFAKGKTINIKEYGKCNSPDVVVEIAKGKLHEAKYKWTSNNCEHFASYCKTNKHESEQVNRFGASVGGTLGSIAPIASKFAAKASIEAAKKSIDPISKVLINVGIKQAPRVAVAGRVAGGVANAAGIVSGVATDMVVGKWLEDNEHLPEQEREARKHGRDTSKYATLAGGIAGTAAVLMVGGTAAVAAAVAAPAVLGIGTAVVAYNIAKGDKK